MNRIRNIVEIETQASIATRELPLPCGEHWSSKNTVISAALIGSLKTYGLVDAKRRAIARYVFHGSNRKTFMRAHEIAETWYHDQILDNC
jgi:hypothetical protein